MQDNTAVLFHFSKKNLIQWQDNYQNYSQQEKNISILISSIESFLARVLELKVSVFFAFEIENNFTKKIHSIFKSITSAEKKIVEIQYQHELSIIQDLFSQHKYQNILFFDTLYLLFDKKITNHLLSIHDEYKADYSYAENLPSGICPVIFSNFLIKALQANIVNIETNDTQDKLPELPMPLAQYIEKNINKFHVEIHYELPDLRMYRLDFSSKTYRSFYKTILFYENIKDFENPYSEIQTIINKQPQILFTHPSYIELEIFSDCDMKCTFCPRQFISTDKVEMSLEKITELTKIVDNSYKDTSITIGGLGEPLLHSQALSVLEKLLNFNNLNSLILETNGYHLDKIYQLIEHEHFHKFKLIVNINSLSHYEELHGVNSLERIKDQLQEYATLVKDKDENLLKNQYIQMLKMTTNENDVDELFVYIQELGFEFLFQKYNRYIDLMPEKRVSDMTPLERSFCWHLRRDLVIKANGDIPFCKQDIQNKATRGNIFTDGFDKIWENQKQSWIQNHKKEYPNSPDCKNCDEYFTFNY